MHSDFHLYIPIEKVDKETRTVAGWATTEAIDKQGEIVDYGASKNAFSEWKGNLREMHEAKAVGKAIEVVPHDDERRVWVKAYVSKGAEDTWQKCVDGTLTGFSIGGNTIDKAYQIVKDGTTPRQVTRITKYRLNELSLVDNPANPDSGFQLVKMAGDGTLQQTELVEDIKKVVVTEAKDLVSDEVKEYREKADSLAKKVMTEDDLDKLADDEFGLVRRFNSPQGTQVKERLFAMPDKVHAFAAIKKVASYPLSEAEREQVHSKAKEVLGSSHKLEDCTICKTILIRKDGDTDNMDTKIMEELVTKMATLVESFGNMVKSFEGINKPVAGAKETPKQEGNNPTNAPAVSQSSPEKSGDPGAKDVKTEDVSPAVPVKKDAEGTPTEKAANPATSDLKTQDVPAVPVKKEVEKAANPATSDLKTQEGTAAPVKKDAAADAAAVAEDGDDAPVASAKPVEKAANPATSDLQTQDTMAAPVKKVADSDTSEIRKLTDTVSSLRKQVDDLMKQPLPRKYKVEKTYGAEGADEPIVDESAALQKEYTEVHAAVRRHVERGETIPADLRKRADALTDASLAKKAGEGQNLIKLR